jgi:hypothetical protein
MLEVVVSDVLGRTGGGCVVVGRVLVAARPADVEGRWVFVLHVSHRVARHVTLVCRSGCRRTDRV